MATAEFVLKMIDRYGISAVLLVVVLLILRRVCLWLKPWIERLAQAVISLCETLSANDTKHIDAVRELKASNVDGHETTHRQLGDVQRELQVIKSTIVK